MSRNNRHPHSPLIRILRVPHTPTRTPTPGVINIPGPLAPRHAAPVPRGGTWPRLLLLGHARIHAAADRRGVLVVTAAEAAAGAGGGGGGSERREAGASVAAAHEGATDARQDHEEDEDADAAGDADDERLVAVDPGLDFLGEVGAFALALKREMGGVNFYLVGRRVVERIDGGKKGRKEGMGCLRSRNVRHPHRSSRLRNSVADRNTCRDQTPDSRS